MTVEEVAAWVQAIGSVAAIFVSVWLIHRQQRLHVNRRARSLSALLDKVGDTARASIRQNQLPSVANQWQSNTLMQRESLLALRELFERLDLSEIDQSSVWREFSELWVELNLIIRVLAEHEEWGRTHLANSPVDQLRAQSLEKHFSVLAARTKDTRAAIAKAYPEGRRSLEGATPLGG